MDSGILSLTLSLSLLTILLKQEKNTAIKIKDNHFEMFPIFSCSEDKNKLENYVLS